MEKVLLISSASGSFLPPIVLTSGCTKAGSPSALLILNSASDDTLQGAKDAIKG